MDSKLSAPDVSFAAAVQNGVWTVLDTATCSLKLISAQTSQEETKITKAYYRGSPVSTNFGLPGNRTIEKSY